MCDRVFGRLDTDLPAFLSPTVKMEGQVVTTYRTTWCHIPEEPQFPYRNNTITTQHTESAPAVECLRDNAIGWKFEHLFEIVQRRRQYRAVGAMRIGRGNRSTRRKPAPFPLCPPEIPHDLIRVWTSDVAVEDRIITTWATAQLCLVSTGFVHIRKQKVGGDIRTFD
jgi:hypothetical protein